MKHSLFNLLAPVLTAVLLMSTQAKAVETADTCSPKNLISEIPSAPRSQGWSNWCFAYSATDLLEQKLGVKIASADLAIKFLKRNPRLVGSDSFFDTGGILDETIDQIAKTEGICSEEDLPIKGEDIDYLIALTKGKVDRKTPPEKILENLARIFPKIESRILQRFLDRYRANPHDAREIEDLEINLIGMACKNRISIPAVHTNISQCVALPCPNLTDQIDRSLDKNKLSSVNVIFAAFKDGPKAKDQHSMTVVGRYKDEKNQCMYVLRDSAWLHRPHLDFEKVDGAYSSISRENLKKILKIVTSLAN